MARVVHPIEKQSYEILRARADTSALPPWTRAVVERVIHASADLGYLGDLVCAEADLAAGAQALRDGAPVVADSAMTAAGITAREVVCRIDDRRATALTRVLGITRSAAGIRVAGGEVGPGAVWVIGTAPTALADLLARGPAPALVIGLPVGFVGAVEEKQALRDSGLPAVTNRSEKGGAAVAAAALNALLYGDPLEELEMETPPQSAGRALRRSATRSPGAETVLPGGPPRAPDGPPAPPNYAPPARPGAVLAGAPPARRPARETDDK
jgi:precorrin-8X/cobalt-precorrin-8 methylmutase